jgi:integrase/recombinase XerD
MKKASVDFAYLITTFLTIYLPGQKGFSTNTILSYRDTFKLILNYAEYCGIKREKMDFSHFTGEFAENFLDWLEKEQHSSCSTRNQRLAAIRSFAKFVISKNPQHLLECHKILAIKSKKTPAPPVTYLTPVALQHILAEPDAADRFGRRDRVLLCLMYDSGGRVQEMCDLRIRDVRTQYPPTVTFFKGKGGRTRTVPIMKETAAAVQKFLEENKLTTPDKLDYPLFFNHQNGPLTRAGVTYILKKYADSARAKNPEMPLQVSPHVLRHSKAMHLLQGGINIIYIRDILGHVHLDTTQIYARTDTEDKRKAIENSTVSIDSDLSDWTQDKSLMSMLNSISG